MRAAKLKFLTEVDPSFILHHASVNSLRPKDTPSERKRRGAFRYIILRNSGDSLVTVSQALEEYGFY
jgi:hypothetical protein